MKARGNGEFSYVCRERRMSQGTGRGSVDHGGEKSIRSRIHSEACLRLVLMFVEMQVFLLFSGQARFCDISVAYYYLLSG